MCVRGYFLVERAPKGWNIQKYEELKKETFVQEEKCFLASLWKVFQMA